jgi:ribosomal protein S18
MTLSPPLRSDYRVLKRADQANQSEPKRELEVIVRRGRYLGMLA